MNKKFKEKLSLDFFVFFSFLALILFGILSSWLFPKKNNINLNNQNKTESNNQYYFNENYKNDDPYITKNPGLKNILAGPIISDNDPMQGDKFSPVTLVYFSDFTCFFCRTQEQVLKKLTADYKYKVKMIWKDYPEIEEDSISYKAALAARCAQKQDKFWQFHDFLFENSENLNEDKFFEIADTLNLNINDFKNCYNNKSTKEQVDETIEEANALGITGIPFIYVNDKEVMGEISYKELEQLVKMELK